MGQTFRSYQPWEVALSALDLADLSTAERLKVGDIVEVRRPLGGIGQAEAHTYVWLLLEGLEDGKMEQLKETLYAGMTADRVPIAPHYDKRRYCVPFRRLQQVVPTFDILRARDATVLYQPFLPVSTDGHYFRLGNPARRGVQPLPAGLGRPLSVHGLVFDKRVWRYL